MGSVIKLGAGATGAFWPETHVGLAAGDREDLDVEEVLEFGGGVGGTNVILHLWLAKRPDFGVQRRLHQQVEDRGSNQSWLEVQGVYLLENPVEFCRFQAMEVDLGFRKLRQFGKPKW